MDKTTKKTTSAAPGKKKVIRRLVKNAKTGEIIKTEIVRIDSSGERTVTSYPAGTPVPSLSSLQSSSQVKKTSTRKPSVETKPSSPSIRRPSQEDSATTNTDPESQSGLAPPLTEDTKPPKPISQVNNDKMEADDVGPSVPTNVPGLEDLIKKEEEMRRMSESGLDRHEKAKPKVGEESLETALISIMRKKRQRDPKAKRRGLVASTMARRTSDDELDKALDDAYEDTDYRTMHSKKDENQEDEEAEKKRKERHRRRKEKKQRERSQADRDDVEEYQGETGPLNLPEIDSYRKRDEEIPMEGVEGGIPSQPAESDEELSKKLEDASIKPEGESQDQPVQEKDEDESGSEDDKKKKKKKHKHKKKKKKTKKQKKRESKSGSDKEDEKDEREKRKSKSRSRSRSLSSLSMSSISSAFSDSFDFAGMNFDPAEEGGFDKALMEYQHMREQVLGNQFGRGFDPFFRGRGGFHRGRGFPPGRFPGPFPGPPWGAPGPMFHFYQPDPNFMFPGAMGPDGEKDKGRGRGVPASQGPWRGRGLRGRGVPPGFHRNYTEDDHGGGLYVEDSHSSSSESGRKKKKKKHRRRSYSSSSYSSSGSSRSRSRSRRRHRRRHRSSSYSSRSSRSYSRSSYSSRSYRSYSRSSRSSYSRSRSPYSRSRSRSSRRSRSPSREGSRKPWGYEDGDRRASPSYHAYDEDGFKPPVREPHSDDEEVPWWAEFDKTYEVEKKKLEQEKKKLEEEEKAIKGEPKEPQLPSIVSTDEIDVVRCVMSLVDKARAQQDEVLESARECIDDIITRITTAPVQATQLHEEVEDPFDKVIHDCVDSMLDRVCPNDPQTAARLCLKEIIDTVVEQEEEDKANEEATEMEKEITESAQSKLYQCYLKAQKLTEQIKAERKAKGLTDEGADGGKDDNDDDDDKGKGDDRRRDKRGHRSRHRKRSKSRERGRRRRRHTSSDSRSSSRSSDARIPLVSKESLQQAQAVLMMQQQQLQVAGLLGTGMPNLAGLNQAAALAAGITPALLAQTGLKSSDLPTLTGEKPPEKPEEESSKFTKWDKDKDAMSKKDDLTRKLMQRMREKKLKQEEGDASPTFQNRSKDKAADVTTTDKVFSGPTSLKSRKIAISSTFGKLWSKVEGSPKRDDDSQESKPEAKGYNKSEIIAATAEVKDQQPSAERIKAEEQEKKLAAWSDEQAKLKEAAKREMREQIERAERAKKEQMKEEILEQERQKEIMRIREEVRNQIRKEIQEEIEKQRKSVLEDPAMRGKLLELEALRSQSGLISSDGVSVPSAPSSSGMPASTTSAVPAMTGVSQMRDQRWYQQQMKNKQDMQKWMEGHGYYESEMDEATMKRMQMTYMQNWTPVQKQGYMRWYWQQKQYPGPGYYPPRQQHMMGQRPPAASQGSAIPQLLRSRNAKPEFQNHDSIFTRAPSQPQHPVSRARGIPGHRMPYGQRPPQPSVAAMMTRPQAPGAMERPRIPGQGYPGQPPSHPPPQYHEMEGQTLDYNHDTRYHPRPQQPGLSLPQQGQVQPVQTQPQENQTESKNNMQQVDPNPIQTKTSADPTQQEQSDQPLHQYPPPGLEEEDEHEGLVAVPPVPPHGVLKQVAVLDQPPPPGESVENSGPAGVGLAPPGEEMNSTIAPPSVSPGDQAVADDDSPSKLKKKKKQKKHRKHKKKRYSSSDEEEDKDPEAEKAAILAQLKNLKDVEDGEIASDDAAAPAAEVEKEVRKKKKHKKEKRKRKRRKDDSSDEEQESQTPKPIPSQSGMPTQPNFYPPPGQVRPPFDMQNRPNFPGQIPGEHRLSNFPPHSAAERFGHYPPPTAPFLGDRERPGFMPHPRDRRGAGEPQHMVRRPEQHQQAMGPGGDHNPPQRKRTPSPLPLVIPTDPQEFELWQRKMEARYNDADPAKTTDMPGPGKHQDAPLNVDQQLLKDIESIRRRQGERDLPGDANDDVIMMMRMMEEDQRRQRPAPHDRPVRESRKRGHGHMPRGRKRQRRLPRRNYHDWDKPEDDGLIYCQSGSDSSDWGSDTNMDFDRMLAKKRKEAEKRDNMPHQPTPPHAARSPGHMMGWDRREMPRKEDLLQGEKPQGIPVIGGGPRPIPTNVSSGRPTPPHHHHPDMMGAQGGLDFLPPDVIKLPPQFPPTSYPHDPHLMDQRRDPGFPPPPMPPSAHPIPRLGQGAPPIPPMMLNPPMQPRMHPMDFRPRYPM